MYTKSDVFSVTEGIVTTHNPEFTSIEIYSLHRTTKDVLDLTEGIISRTFSPKVLGTTLVPYGEYEVELKAPWKRNSLWSIRLKK